MDRIVSDKEHRGLSSRERNILGEIMRNGKYTIKNKDITEKFGLSRPLANKILLRLEKKEWLKRASRGVYILVPLSSPHPDIAPEDPWAMAMELFSPCYISGFSAAEYWDLTEQVFNTLVVFTTHHQRKSTRRMVHIHFRIHRIPERELFGTKKIWRNNIPLHVADRHRTVIDALDIPKLAGGGRHMMDILRTYWTSRDSNPELLLKYALKLNRGVIFKRLAFTGELLGKVSDTWLKSCRDHISSGISKLDPAGPEKGPIITRWKLRINVPLEET